MASGCKITDAVVDAFSHVCKKSAKGEKLKYAVFKFSDKLESIVVEKSVKQTEDDDNDYDAVIASLPSNDVRYLAYDMGYVNKDGVWKSDIIFLSWHPQESPVKKKMVCASSFNALKSKLNVTKNCVEGDETCEVDCKAILDRIGGLSHKKQ